MSTEPPTPTTLRPWQEVVKERGLNLRVLGVMLNRPHSTMRAYSIGVRRMPDILLEKLARILGEPVR